MEESPVGLRSDASSSLLPHVLGLWVFFLLSGCSANPTALEIVKDVKPLKNIKISQICIQLNTNTGNEYANDLHEAITALGFKTMAKQAAFRGECQYSLSYRITWAGYVPKWPLTINVTVYDGRSQIGYVRYDASRGSSRPDKYGTAMSKLKPLLVELFAEVDR